MTVTSQLTQNHIQEAHTSWYVLHAPFSCRCYFMESVFPSGALCNPLTHPLSSHSRPTQKRQLHLLVHTGDICGLQKLGHEHLGAHCPSYYIIRTSLKEECRLATSFSREASGCETVKDRGKNRTCHHPAHSNVNS